MYTINDVSSLEHLYSAYQKCREESDWKKSVLVYGIGLWKNLLHTRDALNNGCYQQREFDIFTINERGKIREIKSIHISDRVVQRSLCDNILTPLIEPRLIYDNGASQAGKGPDFTRNRVKEHLRRYFREYHTNEGYVVLIDFQNYFGSINHDILIEKYRKIILDKQVMSLVEYLVRVNPGNVGLGIGAQLSQNAGIFYPNNIDQYFKTVLGVKYYDVYMDDRLILTRTKEEAERFLEIFIKMSEDLKLTVGRKKTRIVPLEKGFTFLKSRFFLTATGKVVEHKDRSTFIREQRRLKAFARKGMSYERALVCYQSWRGAHKKDKHNKKRLKKMDKLFTQLYPSYITYSDVGIRQHIIMEVLYENH